jgi:hypothetical protein
MSDELLIYFIGTGILFIFFKIIDLLFYILFPGRSPSGEVRRGYSYCKSKDGWGFWINNETGRWEIDFKDPDIIKDIKRKFKEGE